MAKLKCEAHNRRVYVWDDGQGAVTVHRQDGTRCVVNPILTMGPNYDTTPSEVLNWGLSSSR